MNIYQHKTLKFLCVIFLTMFLATMSKIMWLLPIQVMASDFYYHWLTFKGNEITFLLMLSWFFCGAFKVLNLALKDSNEKMFINWRYMIKLYALVPIAPLLKLN